MKYILSFFVFIISLAVQAQYKEYAYGTPYRIGDTVQVSSKNSLFKAVKSFTAYTVPSDNQYWDFAGAMSEAKIKELDARLKAAELEIIKQMSTNLLFSESIAAIEDKLDSTPVPVPSTGYLSLPLSTVKTIANQTNAVIENLRFENATGVMIKITNSSNITIRNCFFNKGAAEAINVYMGANIRVENCLFNGVTTGVYASISTGIKVINNQFVNVRKRADNARGQFIQFNNVTGEGNEVSGNKGENFAGESNPEDLINMYGSSGTAISQILIKGNMFRGGGPSGSGGGIIAGDYNGSYITIDGNTLLNPGQYGIAIAGGNNNVVTNNKIFSKQFAWSNIALYIWMQGGATSCANNTVKGNRATWINKNGVSNVAWNAGNCTGTVFENPAPITEAELNVPEHLIDYITPEELLRIRGK